jgi:hypothetical protein
MAELWIHGLYIEDSTDVEITYTNTDGVSRSSQFFNVKPGDVISSLKALSITTTNFAVNSEVRLFLSKHRNMEVPFMMD